jgi:hypothetical protein
MSYILVLYFIHLFWTSLLFYIIMILEHYGLIHTQMSYGGLMDQWNTYVCMYVCMYACMYIYVYVCKFYKRLSRC